MEIDRVEKSAIFFGTLFVVAAVFAVAALVEIKTHQRHVQTLQENQAAHAAELDKLHTLIDAAFAVEVRVIVTDDRIFTERTVEQ